MSRPEKGQRVVVFLPQNPWPPRSGFHQRGLAVIQALVAEGWEVTVASSHLSAHPPWNDAGQRGLLSLGVRQIVIHEPNALDHLFVRAVQKWHRIRRRDRR